MPASTSLPNLNLLASGQSPTDHATAVYRVISAKGQFFFRHFPPARRVLPLDKARTLGTSGKRVSVRRWPGQPCLSWTGRSRRVESALPPIARGRFCLSWEVSRRAGGRGLGKRSSAARLMKREKKASPILPVVIRESQAPRGLTPSCGSGHVLEGCDLRGRPGGLRRQPQQYRGRDKERTVCSGEDAHQ